MTPITGNHKALARHVALAFGTERPPIRRFWDDGKRSDVCILEAVDRPRNGITSYATIGLSDHPLMFERREFGTHVEFVGACESAFSGFDNVLATLAFCVINSGWFCAPGTIFPGAVAMYGLSANLSDIYFAHPFFWGEDELRSTEIGDRKVAWLLAVPISKRETAFAQVHGPQNLEALFTEEGIDIFNLSRASVV